MLVMRFQESSSTVSKNPSQIFLNLVLAVALVPFASSPSESGV